MPVRSGVFVEPTNEDRANWGSKISACTPDWGRNDLTTDLSDALADVRHFIHRCGLDPDFIWDRATDAAEGDLEDGPEAVFDPKIASLHGERERRGRA